MLCILFILVVIWIARYSFYNTSKWEKLRQFVIDRSGGLCEECHINKGDTAHHKIWVDENNCNDAAIVWGIDNLECVCRDCHSKLHHPDCKCTMDGLGFDINGNLIKVDDYEQNK